ncbi:N-acetyltransferase [Alkalihalobacillus sp. LMS6]|uniref:GNAT family N-acetyltransferase n=1 Tax=Alkalihalobacillus sp. LMS6 TaxID=2924034 RepID=UPI0020D00FD1|nr:N-acetyltransferase [Alkalihalobacillus sp. LMS6]UTR05976.1 N-acetyltransferase [Alkalihalobacillus sp. LMS6]
MTITIRQEIKSDYPITETVIEEAFKNEEQSNHQEHLLVGKIRKSDAFIPQLSLVAVHEDEEIVGHILLSHITIVNGESAVDSLALAPVSVTPSYQNKGIGSQLIHTALQQAKDLGYESVIVLGHDAYYPKFGFKRASTFNIKAPFDVPDEAFMALELTPHALDQVTGVVQYSKPFTE